MRRTTLTTRRLALVLATSASALAAAAPAHADPWAREQPYQNLTAASSPRPDDRAGPLGIGAPTLTTAAAVHAVRPDDRAGVRGVGVSTQSVELRRGGLNASKPTVASLAGSSSGFSWEAFGIGAAAMFGLVLLAAVLIAGGRSMHDAPRVRTS